MKRDSRRLAGQEGIVMEVLSIERNGFKRISAKEIQEMMEGDQTSACLGEQ